MATTNNISVVRSTQLSFEIIIPGDSPRQKFIMGEDDWFPMLDSDGGAIKPMRRQCCGQFFKTRRASANHSRAFHNYIIPLPVEYTCSCGTRTKDVEKVAYHTCYEVVMHLELQKQNDHEATKRALNRQHMFSGRFWKFFSSERPTPVFQKTTHLFDQEFCFNTTKFTLKFSRDDTFTDAWIKKLRHLKVATSPKKPNIPKAVWWRRCNANALALPHQWRHVHSDDPQHL